MSVRLFNMYYTDRRLDIWRDAITLHHTIGELVINEKWDESFKVSEEYRGRNLIWTLQLQERYRTQERYNTLFNEDHKNRKTILTEFLQKGDPSILSLIMQHTQPTEEQPSTESIESIQRLAQRQELEKIGFPVLKRLPLVLVNVSYLSYWASFHSSLNRLIKKFARFNIDNTSLDELQSSINNEYDKIVKQLMNLQYAIATGSREVVCDAYKTTILNAESTMEYLVRLAALSETLSFNSLNNNEISMKLGEVNLASGVVARLWILNLVGASFYNFLAISASKLFEKESRRARRLRFESEAPDGRNVTIRQLNTSSEFDDKFVEVKGFMKDFRQRRSSDGKLINEFSLYSTRVEEKINVGAIYVDLSSHGIVNGCFVHVNGIWKQESNLFDVPTLQIDQIRLSDLKDKSWFDNLLTNVRPWLDYYPNSYNIRWSVSRHVENKTDRRSSTKGAGELLKVIKARRME